MIGNTVSQQTVKEWPRDRNWLTTDNQPNPGKVSHTSAVYIAYSFQTVVQVLLRPTRTRKVKVLWDGTYGFSSLFG